MSTTTQYNPNVNLDATLIAAGGSKTVYALVSPETEAAKIAMLGYDDPAVRSEFMSQFREAWTKKQDRYHVEFFDVWHKWSSPVVDLDRDNFPFFYPTAGASEPLRQIIYAYAAGSTHPRIHVFEGEYEGYKAMAEGSHCRVITHKREDWRTITSLIGKDRWEEGDLFCVSQPSAIDGNVWDDFNAFVEMMPDNSIMADITYVGAVPPRAVKERFNLNAKSISSIIFSLSKPFGFYYDRIGGAFFREKDDGLFGNIWFKNLTSIRLGTAALKAHGVFDLPERYAAQQALSAKSLSEQFGYDFVPSDVYVLATATSDADEPIANYLRRADKLRLCVTPFMAELIGTVGEY